MAKVNVENVTIFIHHNIVRITVANTQNKCGNAVPSTRMSESLNRQVVPLKKNKFLENSILKDTKSNTYLGPLFFSLIHL